MINTTCKDCIFKIEENGEQTGCQFGRLEKFIQLGQAVKKDNYYEISRFCNTCRNKDAIKESTKEDVRKEMSTRVAVIVDCRKLENPDYILNSIYKQYLSPAFVFCIFEKCKNASEIFKKLNELFRNKNIGFNLKNYLEHKDLENIIKELVAKNGQYASFFMIVKSKMDYKSIENIDKIINDEMKQVIYFKSNSFDCILNRALMSFGYENIESKLLEIDPQYKEKGFLCEM